MARVHLIRRHPSGIVDPNPPFTPLNLPGLKGWYDASDPATITHAAGSVSQWADKSGAARHATQAGTDFKPSTGTHTIGGRNAIRFHAVPTHLDYVGATGVTTVSTVWLVVKSDDTIVGRITFDGNGNGHRHAVYAAGADVWGQYAGGAPVPSFQSIGAVPAILAAEFTGTGVTRIIKNGGSGLGSVGDAGNNPLDAGWRIGGETGSIAPAGFLLGNIGEVIIYNRTLTTAELNQLGGYLAAKWGVAWSPVP